MGISTMVYNAIFKRTSTFVVAIAAGTFIFERSFDMITEYTFENYNKGKLWKDIKGNYE